MWSTCGRSQLPFVIKLCSVFCCTRGITRTGNKCTRFGKLFFGNFGVPKGCENTGADGEGPSKAATEERNLFKYAWQLRQWKQKLMSAIFLERPDEIAFELLADSTSRSLTILFCSQCITSQYAGCPASWY